MKPAFACAEALRSVQIVSGIGRANGGPSYSVPRLHAALRQAGIDDRMFSDERPGEEVERSAHTTIFTRDFTGLPLLDQLHVSRGLSRRLLDPGAEFDVIHSHGLWRLPNLYAARAAKLRAIPHVISPRGMLSEVALRFSPVAKRLFWTAGQRAALQAACCLHATSDAELCEFRALGLLAPVAVIPNGLDLPSPPAPSEGARPERRTLLYLGRIHPKKGINDLVMAWAAVADAFRDWRLQIVGPGEPAHLQALMRLAAEKQAPRLEIRGPVYGDEKWLTYRAAELFVLPTYNENFGLTVGESLACGRPVIVSKGAPWSGIGQYRCGWWIDIGHESLTCALREALAMPRETLGEMGRRGADWVGDAFAWTPIGREMARVYAWICGRGPRPDSVHVGGGGFAPGGEVTGRTPGFRAGAYRPFEPARHRFSPLASVR